MSGGDDYDPDLDGKFEEYRKKRTMPYRCDYSDCGWCYHPHAKKPYGCPGLANCPFTKTKGNNNDCY